MKITILITLCCASLMLVTPFTTVAQENKISSNLQEEPNMDGLIAQIRTVVDEILEKYGHIPMVRNLCNMIINSLGLIGKIIYCLFLLIISITLGIVFVILFAFLGFEEVGYYFGAIAFILIVTYDNNCPPGTPLNNLLSPFQSIYTMSETKDKLTNTFDGCPCLQE